MTQPLPSKILKITWQRYALSWAPSSWFHVSIVCRLVRVCLFVCPGVTDVCPLCYVGRKSLKAAVKANESHEQDVSYHRCCWYWSALVNTSDWFSVCLDSCDVCDLLVVHLLAVPPSAKSSFASRAFHTSLPNNWNSLPLHIRSSDSLATFKCHFKSHLFSSACHV